MKFFIDTANLDQIREAEPLEGLHLELLVEHSAARVSREAPGLPPGDALREGRLAMGAGR